MPGSDDLKREAHALIDALPADARWEDVMYEVYVRQAVEAGEKEVEKGRLLSSAQVRARIRKRLRNGQ